MKRKLADLKGREAAYEVNDDLTRTITNTAMQRTYVDMVRGLGSLFGVDTWVAHADAIQAGLPKEAAVYMDLETRKTVVTTTEVVTDVTVTLAAGGVGSTALRGGRTVAAFMESRTIAADAGKAARTVAEAGGTPQEQRDAAALAAAASA